MTTPSSWILLFSARHLLLVFHCQYTPQSKFDLHYSEHRLFLSSSGSWKHVGFWGGPKGDIVSFGADSKCMESPKGSVLFGKGLARTPSHTARADIAYSRERDNLSVHEQQETVELTSFKLFCHTGKKACGSMFCLCICSGSHLTCSG